MMPTPGRFTRGSSAEEIKHNVKLLGRSRGHSAGKDARPLYRLLGTEPLGRLQDLVSSKKHGHAATANTLQLRPLSVGVQRTPVCERDVQAVDAPVSKVPGREQRRVSAVGKATGPHASVRQLVLVQHNRPALRVLVKPEEEVLVPLRREGGVRHQRRRVVRGHVGDGIQLRSRFGTQKI